MTKHYLHRVFEPQSVAIVGASERQDSVGGLVLCELRESDFHGESCPVNPKYKRIQGLPAYATTGDIDRPLGLAVMAIPPGSIAPVLRD